MAAEHAPPQRAPIQPWAGLGEEASGALCEKLATLEFQTRRENLYRMEKAARLPPQAVDAIRQGEVDAVIIARDDHESHFEMSLPFLEAGLPVFVDTTLSAASNPLFRRNPTVCSSSASFAVNASWIVPSTPCCAALSAMSRRKSPRSAVSAVRAA